MIMGPLATMIPKVPKNEAKVLAFYSGLASFGHLFFAPKARGGRADFRDRVLTVARDTGRPVAEVADEV